jgi:hypothetical protein
MKNNQTTFQQIVNDLTPKEKQMLRDANSPEWVKAVRELVADPAFWQDILNSFIIGVVSGIAEAIENNDR